MPRPTDSAVGPRAVRARLVIAVAALVTLAACTSATHNAAIASGPGLSSSAATASSASGLAPAPVSPVVWPASPVASPSAPASSSPPLTPTIVSSPSPIAPAVRVTPSPSTSGTAVAKPTPTATPTATIAPVAGQPLAGKVIVLDPGHNLNNSSSINTIVNAGNGVFKACDTTGTSTNGGYPEHAFTWDVANRAAALLRAEGATVMLTRPSDSGIGPCITTRAQIGNEAHASAFIAIHADGGPAGGHGFFVMQPPPNNPNVNPGGAAQSRVLATVMHDTFHAVTGYPYSTYIAGGYYPNSTITGTINLSHGPVITIECLNMRNAGDAAIATNPADRQRIAAGITAGLTAFLST